MACPDLLDTTPSLSLILLSDGPGRTTPMEVLPRVHNWEPNHFATGHSRSDDGHLVAWTWAYLDCCSSCPDDWRSDLGALSTDIMPEKEVPFWRVWRVLSVVWCRHGVILGWLTDVPVWTGDLQSDTKTSVWSQPKCSFPGCQKEKECICCPRREK